VEETLKVYICALYWTPVAINHRHNNYSYYFYSANEAMRDINVLTLHLISPYAPSR
jgi:hypothetical protein